MTIDDHASIMHCKQCVDILSFDHLCLELDLILLDRDH